MYKWLQKGDRLRQFFKQTRGCDFGTNKEFIIEIDGRKLSVRSLG